MSIWDPHTYKSGGVPIGPVAPAALRVHGAPPTQDQLGQAQATFYRFCMQARVSQAPNPVETGRLPDGTAYRIVRVGNSTTMQIWTEEADEGERNSGIAIVLTDLEGKSIPGHVESDAPALYLLTPEVVRGSRIPSGRWRVRRRKVLQGGKAVNADGSGRVYFAGVQGVADQNIPFIRSAVSLNGQAYWYDDMQENVAVSRESVQVAVSGSATSPIPFVYTERGGKKYSMHIDIEPDAISPARYWMQLRVGPIVQRGSDYVGEVVWREMLPPGLGLDFRTITFSSDGRSARAIAYESGKTKFVLFLITTASVGVSVVRELPSSRQTGVFYNRSFKVEESGTPNEPGYNRQTWDIFGYGDGSAEYGSTTPVDTVNGYLGPGRDYGSGEFVFKDYTQGDWAYSRRGLPLSGEDETRTASVSSYSDKYSSFSIITVPTETTPLHTIGSSSETRRRTDVVSGFGGDRTTLQYSDSFSLQSEAIATEVSTTASGEGSEMINTGGQSLLFDDLDYKFRIYYEENKVRSTAWQYVTDPDAEFGYRKELTSDVYSESNSLNVSLNNSSVLTMDFDPMGPYRHVVIFASDPMTGAIVVNLQEVLQETRAVRRSWIFAVDDHGVKQIQDLMRLPAAPNVKARSNAEIFSV
ncbi:hypothetical protein [Delftia sp. CH05]|uniref:hypothetical protein n=1 Tax=Delftia sp. CH05 TaxID=2692194 RepID=UPI00135D7F1A|nr:hypothetical protein [Delftia sp. CH05]MXN31499.1 hypothetical protein [Delftia sp. CH05]